MEFREISWDNFIECIELQVTEEQKLFISSNQHALAEAYIASKEGQVITTFAIYKHEKMVGFIMMYYDDGNGNFEYGSYGVFKIIIDWRYQGKGYGKEAMVKAIEFFKASNYGKARVVELTYKPENLVAKNLYTSLGFVETGNINPSGEVYVESLL
ncbi:GNAT family N-acetyltransferase [Paenibacillus endoradicis]|uniref:GNAT family N-acetyltransferase n=1 Tax=Paenibacillus endoradicis TaxID=2972487 RepID=UPI0021596EB7|nr:GNAT family N-acetyltransferase [Paenibacillus endoradicis]MCR8655900.1 GNAT family N-acetyltransferase [Paenibacillus endoradicis]MCR8658226.1 GNAT family N-acetyltransferase [Paenibacillus endoradicis]